MKHFRVILKKNGKHFFIQVPELIADLHGFSDGDEIEISFHALENELQCDLWDDSPREINQVDVILSRETHSMNMYNRIYVPSKFRFFFPPAGKRFILETNVGNLTTDLTHDGFLKRNIRPWFSKNGPLETGNCLRFSKSSSKYHHIALEFLSKKKMKE